MRIEQGYDAYRLAKGRKLMLGDADIPYERGSLGCSDADVFLYAAPDVLLGTAALGDISTHFPDSDPACSGADNTEPLRAIGNLIRTAGCEIGNVDSTVVCQVPKLVPHAGAMRTRTAEVLVLPTEAVSVKASGEERMRFAGRGEGIATYTMCLLMERAKRKFTIR